MGPNIYDPRHQMISLDGQIINGWAKGDFITITLEHDSVNTYHRGCNPWQFTRSYC